MDIFKRGARNPKTTSHLQVRNVAVKETQDEKIRRGAKDFATRFEGVMRELANG